MRCIAFAVLLQVVTKVLLLGISLEKLFVIIVTYNGMKWIKKCIKSVLESTIVPTILLIDNNSADGTVNFVRKTFTDVVVIPNSKNLGFGQANNIGLEYALHHGCEYVYLLNQDAYVEPDTFETLIRIQKKYPEYGVLSPIQITASRVKLDKNFAKFCGSSSCPGLLSDLLLTGCAKDIYAIDFIMAAHWLMTRDCIEKVGGFNPMFNQYGEDDNMLNRCHYFNIRVGISPRTFAIHDRADRAESVKNLFHMNHVEYYKVSSNINYSNFTMLRKLLRNHMTSLRLAVQYKSFVPILNSWEFLFNIWKVKKCNRISKKSDHPFLSL